MEAIGECVTLTDKRTNIQPFSRNYIARNKLKCLTLETIAALYRHM
jgi:hypothetical protein